MSRWAEVFLGIIAFATLATAIIQIGVLVVAGLLFRRLQRLADHVDQEVRPILGHLNAIGRDAARAASIATLQVERADALFGDLGRRFGQFANRVEASVAAPAREGAAVVQGFRAALDALRGRRAGRARTRGEEEDALFI